MKSIRWQIRLGVILIILSAVVYLIHFMIFRDPHHILIYLFGDIAFVFVEVMMVTLVIHRVLNIHEKRERLEKLNMLIGVFFSDFGTDLLIFFSNSDPNLDKIKKDLIVEKDWTEEEFKRISQKLRKYNYSIEIKKIDLVKLQDFLRIKSDFLLRLLENPNLLEHESFTDKAFALFDSQTCK